MSYLKIKCADVLSHIFIKIAQNQGKAEFKGKGETLRVVLPTIFVPNPVNPKYFLWNIAVNQSQIQKGYVAFQIVLLPMILNGFCLKGALTHSTLIVSEKFNTVHYVKNYYNTKQRAWQSQKKNVVLNPRIRNSQQNKESESDAPEGEVDSNGTLEDSNINIPECETSNVEANIVNIIDAYVLWHLLHSRLKRNGNSNNNNKPKWPQKL